MTLTLQSSAKLSNGVEMPMLGLGVYQAQPGQSAREAVRWALEAGYRHIDTARIYENEADVGQALRESGVPREQVFVTTKLWNADHGHDRPLSACRESLQRLGLEYLDLYLIHWPVQDARQATWKALETLQREGLCRAIGVSNYMVRHLEELLASCEQPPAVNQVEFHPFLYQKELLEYCRRHGVQLEAYSPLTRGERLSDPTVQAIARRHGRTSAQILIRWCLEHEVVAIPKSVHRDRIRENAQVFDFTLSAAEMAELDALDERAHYCWDPTDAP